MEEVNNNPKKIKKAFYNNIIVSIFINLIIMVIVIAIFFVVLWSYRKDVVNYLVKEYKQDHVVVSNIEIPSKKKAPEVKKETVENTGNIKNTKLTVVDAVKIAKPAVVSIIVSKDIPTYDTTYQKVSVKDSNGNPIPNIYINKPVYTQNGTEKKKLGSGSGFLISSTGLIVTNRHVVAGQDLIVDVLLNNGKEYPAKILDKDPVLDVAFLKITGANLPYLKLSDSSKLEVGESVIAIGNALGEFKNTVSVGVVSGLSRSIYAGDTMGQTEFLDKVIQTDAAINRGNSGGPLLNMNGEVVGINVAVVEGSSSVGFSLPINSLKATIDSVKKTSKIVRPYVGIRYFLINKELQAKYNLLYDHGIWIQKDSLNGTPGVVPSSPADKAGLKEGYIILEIDGETVTENDDFSRFIRAKKIGDFINMKVYTGKEVKTFVLVLEQAPSNM